MKVLVTGASGFVGRHMVQELVSHGYEVTALTYRAEHSAASLPGSIRAIACDLSHRQQVSEVLSSLRPEALIHLAGRAHVVKAGQDIAGLIDVNVLAVKYLCDAILNYASAPVPFLLASTAQVYGAPEGVIAVHEASPTHPVTAYARSKLAAEVLLQCYQDTAIIPYIARPFNHTGPGQSEDFVCPGFVKRVRATPTHQSIKVGNLDALRDLSDVRDIVRAYRLILEKGRDQKHFVLGSGSLVKIGSILERIIAKSGKSIQAEVDSSLLRPSDQFAMYADTKLAQQQLGWLPRFTLDQTLDDLYHSFDSL